MSGLTFFLLCLEGAVLSFNVAASAALVPSIAKEFVLSQFVVGRIVWLYMLPYGMAALLYGPLVRAFDAKKIELICIFLFALANLMAATAANISTLYSARILMGLFGASVIPLGLILIGTHVEPQKRGKFVGFFFSATFVASLAGLFLSGIIYWRYIYFIPAVAGFFLWGVLYLWLPSFHEDTGRIRIHYRAAFKEKKIRAVFMYIFVISLIYHGVQQWLAVYFSSAFGLSQFVVSMLVMVTSLSGIFGEAFGGWMSDVFGRLKTINFGIILMIASVFLLLLKGPVIFIGFLMFAWGLGWTFNHAGVSTVLTDLPKEYLNEAASLNSSVRFIAGGVGAALAGILMRQSFLLGFTIFGLCLLGLLVQSRKLIGKV